MCKAHVLLALGLIVISPAYAENKNNCDLSLSARLKIFSEVVRSQEEGMFWRSKVLLPATPLTPERTRFVITQLMDNSSILNQEVKTVFTQLNLNSAQFWDTFLQIYDRVVPYSDGYLEIFDTADRIFPQSGRYADLGIGTGNGGTRLVTLAPKRQIVGIDSSLPGLKIAKEKLDAIQSKLQMNSPTSNFLLIQGDVADRLLAPGSVDGAIMNNVLYAVPAARRAQALKEVFNALKSGSRLILNDPRDFVQQEKSKLGDFLIAVANSAATNHAPMTEYDLAFLGAINIQFLAGNKAKFLSAGELSELAQQAGFIIESVRLSYYDTCTMLVLRKP